MAGSAEAESWAVAMVPEAAAHMAKGEMVAAAVREVAAAAVGMAMVKGAERMAATVKGTGRMAATEERRRIA